MSLRASFGSVGSGPRATQVVTDHRRALRPATTSCIMKPECAQWSSSCTDQTWNNNLLFGSHKACLHAGIATRYTAAGYPATASTVQSCVNYSWLEKGYQKNY
uniref:SFRICE_027180 n=1 Tax=Spodoptera frugiperda TaxID=7108 RepID=A0A2H1VQE5_SPOFR